MLLYTLATPHTCYATHTRKLLYLVSPSFGDWLFFVLVLIREQSVLERLIARSNVLLFWLERLFAQRALFCVEAIVIRASRTGFYITRPLGGGRLWMFLHRILLRVLLWLRFLHRGYFGFFLHPSHSRLFKNKRQIHLCVWRSSVCVWRSKCGVASVAY